MAKCKGCNKYWSSWGSYDDFCSDACENTRQTKDAEIARELFKTMNDEEIKRLEHLLSSRTGIDMMNTLLENLLKK